MCRTLIGDDKPRHYLIVASSSDRKGGEVIPARTKPFRERRINMQHLRKALWLLVLMTLVLSPGLGWAAANADTTTVETETKADWRFHDIISVDFVKDWVRVPKPENVMIIDSRPKHKYVKGHIPTAMNIPDSKFDQLIDQLPKKKSTILIFYCGGLK